MLDKMTDEAIITVINNAPEGAEYWTGGYDIEYRKLVLDCVFGWFPGDKKWIRAIDNDVAMERVDKGFWIRNLVKELVDRQSKPIPQNKEDRERREREENGQSLYELVQNLWCSVDSKYTAHPYDSPMVDSKTKEMYSMLAVAVEYRKGGE